MSKEAVQKRRARGNTQSIKETIQSLAHQLWVDKRDTMEGVEWLVDGRLMAQLDQLAKSDLLRIQRLLTENAARIPAGNRYMTA